MRRDAWGRPKGAETGVAGRFRDGIGKGRYEGMVLGSNEGYVEGKSEGEVDSEPGDPPRVPPGGLSHLKSSKNNFGFI